MDLQDRKGVQDRLRRDCQEVILQLGVVVYSNVLYCTDVVVRLEVFAEYLYATYGHFYHQLLSSIHRIFYE
jgi:hypothetical protein